MVSLYPNTNSVFIFWNLYIKVTKKWIGSINLLKTITAKYYFKDNRNDLNIDLTAQWLLLKNP